MYTSLKIRKSNALDHIIQLVRQLSLDDNLPYKLSTDMSIYKAMTSSKLNNVADIDDNSAKKVYIGVQEIFEAKRSFPYIRDALISDEDFVNVIINIYHERDHCVQKNKIFKKDKLNELEQAQLIQEIACLDNEPYYTGDSNYKTNANEIQAEHYGIMNAYNYLCKTFSDSDPKQLESIILDIVNDKMMNASYFVEQSEPFKSLQEVNQAFDAAYESSFTKRRIYRVNVKTDDDVKAFVRSHPEASDVYLSLSDPLEQDKFIAAINLEVHPEWREFYPALKHIDLSYETIVLRPYREMQKTMQKRVQSACDICSNIETDNSDDFHNEYRTL